ncbi:MAG: AAA family ATPase [Planctomycetes bacterium]|nr:AAA family ATPase [Planctomycetota bacterium]
MSRQLAEIESEVANFRSDLEELSNTLAEVVVGQEAVIRHVVTALVAGGHVLLEGAPGLGKTLLVRTLAEALHLQFSRVQFTPDLMPADITGTNIVVEESGQRAFRFQRGPVFTNILLADEINRATPKTQSALLEAMQESGVTVAGQRHALPDPFFVLATQNPIEMEGTYPLPEAQLDRFLLKVLVPFPKQEDLARIIDQTTGRSAPRKAAQLDGKRLLELRALAREVIVAPEVRDRAAALVLATHPREAKAPESVKRYVRYGASPRAGQALVLCAKVIALRQGRGHVDFGDLATCAHPTLRHRLILNFEGEAAGITPDRLVDDALKGLGLTPP